MHFAIMLGVSDISIQTSKFEPKLVHNARPPLFVLVPGGVGFNVGFRGQAFDPNFSFGSQFMGRALEFDSLADNKFVGSLSVSSDVIRPSLLAGTDYLSTGANILTPIIGGLQTYNEYQYSGWSGDTLATGGEALFDTSLGFLATANPIAAFVAPAYILGDIALSAVGTDWRGAAEMHYQRTQSLIDMGMRPAEALNIGSKL